MADFTAKFIETPSILVTFKSCDGFKAVFGEEESSFKPNFSEGCGSEYHEYYDGLYSVTPTVEGQTIATENKIMKDDFTIREIPFFEVLNTSGGNTVFIADVIPMVILGKAILGEVTL